MMQPKRYIVWSKSDVDLDDPFQKKWYIRQVLTNGRAECFLDCPEIPYFFINRRSLKVPSGIDTSNSIFLNTTSVFEFFLSLSSIVTRLG
jgi:hypothetical protein